MVFFGVVQYGLYALGVAIFGLDFHQRTFALVPNDKVNFQPRILTEIKQLAFHFIENACGKIFKNGSLVSEKISA